MQSKLRAFVLFSAILGAASGGCADAKKLLEKETDEESDAKGNAKVVHPCEVIPTEKRLKEIKSTNSNGEERDLIEFNEHGLLSVASGNGGLVRVYRQEYTYRETDCLVDSMIHWEAPQAGAILAKSETISYSYDDNDRLVTKSVTTWSGLIATLETYVFTYDDEGRLTKVEASDSKKKPKWVLDWDAKKLAYTELNSYVASVTDEGEYTFYDGLEDILPDPTDSSFPLIDILPLTRKITRVNFGNGNVLVASDVTLACSEDSGSLTCAGVSAERDQTAYEWKFRRPGCRSDPQASLVAPSAWKLYSRNYYIPALDSRMTVSVEFDETECERRRVTIFDQKKNSPAYLESVATTEVDAQGRMTKIEYEARTSASSALTKEFTSEYTYRE